MQFVAHDIDAQQFPALEWLDAERTVARWLGLRRLRRFLAFLNSPMISSVGRLSCSVPSFCVCWRRFRMHLSLGWDMAKAARRPTAGNKESEKAKKDGRF